MNKFMKAMTSLLTTVILVGGLSVGTLFAASADPNEPNDTIGKATSMSLGKTYNGEIGNYNRYKKSGKDVDWFKFNFKKNTINTFVVKGVFPIVETEILAAGTFDLVLHLAL